MSHQSNRRVRLDALYIGLETDHGRLHNSYYGGFLDIAYTGENDVFSIDIDNENGTFVTGYVDRTAAWRLVESLEHALAEDH